MHVKSFGKSDRFPKMETQLPEVALPGLCQQDLQQISEEALVVRK